MRHPGHLTSNFMAQQTLPYTVYDVRHVWQHPPDYSESVLIGTRVEPVTVVEFGLREGCCFPDITCVDIKGRKFIGDPCDYYMTEDAAQAAADAAMDEANKKRDSIDEACNVKRDAQRYRWLREQYWSEGNVVIVDYSKAVIKPGVQCYAGSALDSMVDRATAKGEI